MAHQFEVDIAVEYGVNAAILFQNISFWCEKNKANGHNFFDGNYWTFNSRKAFTELFPYLSEHQIKIAIDKLVNDGLLVTGCYNKDQRDRSLWYAVTEKGWCKLHNCKMQTEKTSNARGKNVRPLPDINSDVNADINVSKNTSYSCSEPEESVSKPHEPAVISVPLNDGTEHPVTQTDIDKYASLYPAVDVMQELRKMVGWLDGNPTRKKTRRGIKRFINGWLAREQDKGGLRPPAPTTQPQQNAFGLDRRTNKTPEKYGGGIVV